MTTSFVSSNVLANGTRTNSTVPAPASIADKDILRLTFAIAAEPGPVPTPAPPTGFSQILHTAADNSFGGGGLGDLHLWIWEKLASSESGSYVVTHSSAITEAYIECVRGGVPAVPASDFSPTTNTVLGAGTNYTATGGSTSVDGSFITFIIAAWNSENPVTPPAGTTPTFTERNDPVGGVLYAANGILTTAGATGNKTATGTDQGATGGYIASLISVKNATPIGPGVLLAQSSAASGSGTVTGTVAGTAVFLYQGETNPNDVRLIDPTTVASTAVHGTGILLDASSSLSGAGTSRSTGTGALAASASSVAGTGTVSSPITITGSGALLDQESHIAGIATIKSTGTGVLLSQASHVAGDGVAGTVGTGALLSQNSVLSGLAAARWVARSELYLLEDGTGNYLLEDGSGRYAIEEVRILSSSSQISGSGTTASTGAGSLVAGGSSIEGNDTISTGPISKTRHIIYMKGRRHKSSHREMDELLDRVFSPDEAIQVPAPLVEQVHAIVQPFVYKNELNVAKLYKDMKATRALFAAWEAEVGRRAAEDEDDDESILLMG